MCNCPSVPCAPLWWLETDFGLWVFVLVFLTWGLLMIALVLHILYLVRKLSPGEKPKPKTMTKTRKRKK